MKEQKFIIDEVKKHLQAIARKNKYQVIDAVQEMPTFEGFILPYYVSTMEGAKYPVNVRICTYTAMSGKSSITRR